ncbi:hypothetical protein ACA910_004021 [Epithemia clementina (nom. ined.)]
MSSLSSSAYKNSNRQHDNKTNSQQQQQQQQDRFFALWNHGIDLWETEGAYLDAMQVWETAVLDEIPEVAPFLLSMDREDEPTDPLLPPRPPNLLVADDNNDDDDDEIPWLLATRAAPLLFFLAGCYLDAGEYHKARQYCRATWKFARLHSTSRTTTTTIITTTTTKRTTGPEQGQPPPALDPHTILLEYMATFEEDSSMAQPWIKSRHIVQEALQQQQEQQQEQQLSSPSSSSRSWSLLWQSPYQRPGFCYPIFVGGEGEHTNYNVPVCPREYHPAWCRLLEDQYEMIRHEFLELCRRRNHHHHSIGHRHDATPYPKTNHDKNDSSNVLLFPHHWPVVGDGSHRHGAGSHDGSVVQSTATTTAAANHDPGGDWREWVLFGSGAASAVEHPNTTVAPHTRAWIQRHIPEAVDLAQQGGGEVIFSVLAPQTRIAPHCASTNLRWTAHLGLVVWNDNTHNNNVTNTGVESEGEDDGDHAKRDPQPVEAQHDLANAASSSLPLPLPMQRIRVADQWYTWQEGQVLVFDDSYEHEVWNTSATQFRAVLLLRFWHPQLLVVNNKVPQKRRRDEAMQQALAWKQHDEYRRYHPPHPTTSPSKLD